MPKRAKKRNMTAAERREFKKLCAEIAVLERKIARIRARVERMQPPLVRLRQIEREVRRKVFGRGPRSA